MSESASIRSRFIFFGILQTLAIAAAVVLGAIAYRVATDPDLNGALALFVIAGLYFAGLFAAFVAHLIARSNAGKVVRAWAIGFLAVYAIPSPIAVIFAFLMWIGSTGA